MKKKTYFIIGLVIGISDMLWPVMGAIFKPLDSPNSKMMRAAFKNKHGLSMAIWIVENLLKILLWPLSLAFTVVAGIDMIIKDRKGEKSKLWDDSLGGWCV